MAITLEQQEKPKNWTLIIGAFFFIVLIFAVAYYFFFKNPEAIEELAASTDQKQIQSLSQIKPDYARLVDQLNSSYKRGSGDAIVTPQMGKQNPFSPL